ncbi:MAG TPA: OpgC domain-containing protein [Xanthobacteraceae bacterium]|nr:OpgC domain-containing protein [Xanthobacteraceae bacterium]
MADQRSRSTRDPRLDVLRGLALFMIFVDHIPNNVLGLATLHNFGFSDAAELFVFIAGMSSMLAYGSAFERHGAVAGLSRIVRRWLRLYVFQIGLLLTTLAVVFGWTRYYGTEPRIVRPFFNAPLSGIMHGLALQAVPTYLDILPLYLALFAVFPLIYAGLRIAPWLTIVASAALWGAANIVPSLNLPNWVGSGHWFFNPFAWQLLFTIGAAVAMNMQAGDSKLPYLRPLAWLSAGYLAFAFVESAPWTAWHLPDLRPIDIAPPNETDLSALRLLDILAFSYLVFSSAVTRSIANWRIFQPVALCGRHSLEVFATGCIAALFGRLLFHTFGGGLWLQLLVNGAGFAVMWAVGWCLARATSKGGAKAGSVASLRGSLMRSDISPRAGARRMATVPSRVPDWP